MSSHPAFVSSQPLINVHQAVKAYKTPAGDFLALKGIDVEFYPGEFVGILGKSGAGKTTLVNTLTGVDRLTSGEIWYKDLPIHKMGENQASRWRSNNLGVIFQTFQLMPSMSLLDNVLLAMDFAGNYRPIRSAERAMELLRAVEIEEHAHKLPSDISGGQQQRVAIARALANDPDVLVADEPTGRLDSVTAEVIFEIFENLVQQGKTVIMVSHDPSFYQRYSRVIWIADGQISDQPQFDVM